MSSAHVASRHRLLLIFLWAHVPLVAVLGLLSGEPLLGVALTSLLLILFAAGGMLIPTVVGASVSVALGLVSASVVLAAYAPYPAFGSLHALVMVGVVSLYRMWQPLLAAVWGVTVYHLYDAFVASSGATLTTAAIQSAFAALLALALAAGWRGVATTESDASALSRLRIAFEEAPMGMAILRPSGEFIQVNRSLGRLLGYEPDEMVGRHIRSIVHTDDMADVGEAWEQMGNSETHSALSWLRCTTASGSTVWGRASLALVSRTEDHPAIVVLEIEDVTRSYQEQRRLEDLLDGKDEFVAAVVEEIKAPLDRIIELAAGPDPQLHEVRGLARGIRAIVDDLVASARTGARTRPVAALPIDADTVCRDVVASLAGNHQVRFEIDAIAIWADPTLTRQILAGLVNNAVRFGGANVTVRTIASGPDTVIQIIDDGPEIPESERERVFVSDLRQGRPATKPATVGLGLTVGRRLARQMDGDLTYRRTAGGENVFELRLPSEQFVGQTRDVDVPA
jgi:PAS domain S-box-containing protein